MLFNEPKLLKLYQSDRRQFDECRFSALQRAEIAEILRVVAQFVARPGFSALQRAEIAEIDVIKGL